MLPGHKAQANLSATMPPPNSRTPPVHSQRSPWMYHTPKPVLTGSPQMEERNRNCII